MNEPPIPTALRVIFGKCLWEVLTLFCSSELNANMLLDELATMLKLTTTTFLFVFFKHFYLVGIFTFSRKSSTTHKSFIPCKLIDFKQYIVYTAAVPLNLQNVFLRFFFTMMFCRTSLLIRFLLIMKPFWSKISFDQKSALLFSLFLLFALIYSLKYCTRK